MPFRLTLSIIVLGLGLASSALADDADMTACGQTGNGPDRQIESCTRLLDRSPALDDSSRAIVFGIRGTAYGRKNDFKREIADETKSIQLKPDDAASYLARGTAYGALGDRDSEIADISKALELKPDYTAARFGLAVAYSSRGLSRVGKHDFERAIADYQKAISIKPDLSTAQDGLPIVYNVRGVEYSSKGDCDRAIADFDKAVKFKPNMAIYYMNRGLAYSCKRDYQNAIANESKAISLEPNLANGYYSRGLVYASKGDYDLAAPDFGNAIRLRADFPLAYAARGAAREKMGYLSLALDDFNQALTFDANLADALAGRKRVLAALEEAKPAPAATAAPLAAAPSALAASPLAAAASPASTEAPPPAKVVATLPDRRVALVIGNSAYRGVAHLPNPTRDADLIGAALRSTGMADVTIIHDADREQTVAALKAFARKADAADWAIIYYAGHGIEIGGVNYLIPVDAKLETDRDVPYEGISLDQLQSTIEGAHKLKLIVLDACRNNPFAAQMKTTVANRSIGRGLSPAEPTGATLIVYAAKGGTSAEDGAGADSPFAFSLAKRILEPGVEINKTFRFVRQDVLQMTSNQEPFVYGSLPPEDFYFVPPK